MTRYITLLGLPFVLLGLFLATGSPALAAVFIAGLGAYLLYAIADRLIHYRQRYVSYLELAWLAYLFVLLIAAVSAAMRFRGYDMVAGVKFVVSLAITASPMLAIPAAVSSRKALRHCIATFDAVGFLITLTVFLSLTGIYRGGDITQSVSGVTRVFGLFGDSVAFAVGLFVCRSWIGKKWISFGFHLVALMVTAGIGGSLTLVVALTAHALLPWRRSSTGAPRGSSKLVSTVIACSLGVIIVAVFGSQLATRLAGPTLVSFTVASRLGTYQVASEIIASSPVIGVGPSGFPAAAAQLAPESLFATFSTVYIATTQNQTLQALCDSGVVGLAVLLMFFIALLRALSKSSRADGFTGQAFRGYQMWLLGLMVGNQSATWFLPFSIIPVLVFTIAGLALAEAWLRDAAPAAQRRLPVEARGVAPALPAM